MKASGQGIRSEAETALALCARTTPREHAGAPLVERVQMQQEIATLRAEAMRQSQRAVAAENMAATLETACWMLFAAFAVAAVALCVVLREVR